MRLSTFGWCCAKECREEATRRLAVCLPECPDLLIPLCDEHLNQSADAMIALNDHPVAVVSEKRR